MGRVPYFPFFVGDWLSSTAITLMSPAEEGAFIRLLAIAWSEEDCGLPDDDEILAQLSRLGDDWRAGSGDKLRRKFRAEGGRLFNDRLLQERQKQKDWSRKSSKGGLKSATSRATKKVKNGCNLVGTKPQPNPNRVVDDWLQPKGKPSLALSLSKKDPPVVPPETDNQLDADFHRLSEQHPNRTKIDEACRLWISLVGKGEITAETVGEVFAGLDRWLASEEWAKEDGRFIPSLARWLDGRRWKDHPRPLESEQQHPPLPEWLGERGEGFPDDEIAQMAEGLGVPK